MLGLFAHVSCVIMTGHLNVHDNRVNAPKSSYIWYFLCFSLCKNIHANMSSCCSNSRWRQRAIASLGFVVPCWGFDLKDALRVELCCGAQLKDLSIQSASSVSAHKKRGTVIAFWFVTLNICICILAKQTSKCGKCHPEEISKSAKADRPGIYFMAFVLLLPN